MIKELCVFRILLFLEVMIFLIFAVLLNVKAGHGIEKPLFDYRLLKDLEPSENSKKVSSSLRTMIKEMEVRGFTRQDARDLGAGMLSNLLVRVNIEGNIQTYIHVDVIGTEERALLEAYDVEVEIADEELGIIQAWIPYNKIEEVAKVDFVKQITPPSYGTPLVGSETTEGDIILTANELRASGFDGRGVKVGVISDGADNRAAAQGTNDLPASITIQTFAGSGDEGTAMLEIVHDLAPGAELGFCGLPTLTSLEMIQCVNDLSGLYEADIIVDDLVFFAEPYFEDGPVAQAVADAVDSGVVYASAAGNSAQGHYQGDFVGTTVLNLGIPEHNFGNAAGGASDPNMDITVLPGQSAVILQWNDPFGGSGNDYDLLIWNETGISILGGSLDIQDGDDNPIEGLAITNLGSSPIKFKVVVIKTGGADRLLKIFLIGAVHIEQFAVPEGSVFGHQAVPGALATGAIRASDPGNNTIEFFSSRGPVEIFFPARETRQKPDVAAIDGVSVSGAGGFPSPFFGTSAAAPHVAGVAALLKGGFTTAAEIIDALKISAVDLGDPGTDNTFGAGRIDALAAAQLLNQSPNGTIDNPTDNNTIIRGQSVDFNGTCTDPNSIVNATFLWDFGAGSGIADSTRKDPGSVVFISSGTFTVSFTCIDGFGEPDPTPDTRTIVVQSAPDGVIDTPTGDKTIERGQSLIFTGSGTDPDGNLPFTFNWDFGGGASNLTKEDPGIVTFDTLGSFTVTFVVTNSLGVADPTPDTRTITVNEPEVNVVNGGGGGGCFISTSANDFRLRK